MLWDLDFSHVGNCVVRFSWSSHTFSSPLWWFDMLSRDHYSRRVIATFVLSHRLQPEFVWQRMPQKYSGTKFFVLPTKENHGEIHFLANALSGDFFWKTEFNFPQHQTGPKKINSWSIAHRLNLNPGAFSGITSSVVAAPPNVGVVLATDEQCWFGVRRFGEITDIGDMRSAIHSWCCGLGFVRSHPSATSFFRRFCHYGEVLNLSIM